MDPLHTLWNVGTRVHNVVTRAQDAQWGEVLHARVHVHVTEETEPLVPFVPRWMVT